MKKQKQRNLWESEEIELLKILTQKTNEGRTPEEVNESKGILTKTYK